MLKVSKKQIKDIKKGVKDTFKKPLNGSITIRCDEDLKKDAMKVFNNVGLDLSTAINIFLKKSVAFGGVPFVVKDDTFFDALQDMQASMKDEAKKAKLFSDEDVVKLIKNIRKKK